MRHIHHPGPIDDASRVRVVPATIRQVDLVLPPGEHLLDALARALAPHQATARSAVLRLSGGGFHPFVYVMPALSKTPEHAVYFSDRFDDARPVQLVTATVTWGIRNNAPWLHVHAVWVDADGVQHCGHLLPTEVTVHAPIRVQATLIDGADFQVRLDEETRFSLFQPEAAQHARLATASAAGGNAALVVRLSPNVDVCTAIEAVCQDRGITRATVHGGVGSTVGAVFDDGRRVEPFVTEMLIRHGEVRSGPDGAPQAVLDVSMVDYTGALSEGRLQRGENAVLVTFEMVLSID